MIGSVFVRPEVNFFLIGAFRLVAKVSRDIPPPDEKDNLWHPGYFSYGYSGQPVFFLISVYFLHFTVTES